MQKYLTRDMIWKLALALVGCFAAAYVGDELLHGGALGWALGCAILAATCFPMFRTLMERGGIGPGR